MTKSPKMSIFRVNNGKDKVVRYDISHSGSKLS